MGEKQMKLAFTIPVVFADYDVRLTVRPPKVEGKEVNGSCDELNRRIRVFHAPFNDELTRASVWHEWVHAVFNELGRPSLSDDEALVDGIANALMRVRLQHPWL
jgi:hypothetical protein